MLALALASLGAQTSARPDSVPAIDSARLLGHIAALSADSMEGRRVDTPGGARARAYLVREVTRLGLSPAYKTLTSEFSGHLPLVRSPTAFPSPRGTRAGDRPPDRGALPAQSRSIFGTNVVGLVRGTEHPDRYIVVSAHYDHLGVRDGAIYNGADDNASGSAAALAIAEWTVAHPPKNSILFAWFDAEEEGMIGSTAFVARPPVPLERVVADVNIDMVSRNVRGELFAAGARRYPVLKPLLDGLADVGLVILRQGHDGDPAADDWTHRSDEEPFHDKHIPFVHFANEEHPDYHEPTDDFERIFPSFFFRNVRTIAEFVRRLDAALDPVAQVRKNGR